MALPTNFSEWEHLQDTIRLWHNKSVNKYFNNTPADSLETPKSSLRVACTMKDSDTATMTMMRMWLFEITAGHAQSLQAPMYAIPVQELQRDVKFKPQIKLYFRERLDQDTTDRISPARGEITIRLMNESSDTISRAKAVELARDIKREFATPVFIWEKGWYKFTYLDTQHGYDLRLFVKSKAEGIRVARQVLQIQGHSFNDDYLNFVEHDRSYPLNQGTHRVYGRTVKKPVQRPRVDLRFRYAQLLIWGQTTAVNLVAMADVGLKSVIERVYDS
ncbi:hypothetical protein NIES21_15220 [Anabaenopsis circularis NIES-21]|uniref:Uncharacterized protein n=1 Tax=Anabaenopsis circularis NIES-21 TaxID=1085406 RepID=A0A1Z4GDV1_9CYAN|nr:hypothetical protein NIES21_15220 [Anabaenopsis circularis NIES-21]